MLTQKLDIGHQMVAGVGLQRALGLAAAAAALIEQDHPTTRRIEQLAMPWRAAAARPPMQENQGQTTALCA